jgi:preprotein translocase subunit YajC
MLYILLQAAQAAPAPKPGGGGNYMSLIMIVAMFAILYFLMIVPQQKKQKQLQQMLDALKENDRIVTTSGIYGRIVSFKPDKNAVVIEIDDTNHIRVEFQRGAIAALAKTEDKPV